jgi:release factor glutamine methyltransferase
MTLGEAAAMAPLGSAGALTIAAARRAMAARFRGAGIESPDLDARVLVGQVMGLDHAALAAASARSLDAAERDAVASLAERRLAGEPVARIVGVKEFWSLPLRVDATTLVPRPETETIVEAALAEIDAHGSRAAVRLVADLGTGCGALVLALLTELPNALGVGTDTSRGALAVASDNARRLGLNRANFIACDMAAALGGPFDLIVSNPPYIVSGDIAALAPEVRDFDPRAALDGGADGLDAYRAIVGMVPGVLRPGGAVVVELGVSQAEAVAALFSAAGLAPAPPRTDLRGIPRALLAKRPA